MVKERFKIIYVILVSAIIGILTFNKVPNTTLDWASFIMLILGFGIDEVIPVCVYVICNFFGVVYDISFQVWINYAIIAYIAIKSYYNCSLYSFIQFKKYLLLFGGIVVSSFLFGAYSDLKVALNILIMFLILYSFIIFGANKSKENIVIASFYSAGFAIALFTIYQFATGQLELMGTVKLNYGENVRSLSNAIAFPFFYSGYKIISNLNKKVRFSSLWVGAFVFTGIVLVLSYSRGVILSSFISLALVFVFGIRSANKGKLILVTLLIFGFFQILGSLDIDNEKMYDDASSIDRVEFWGFMFSKMTSEPMTLLFGFGPCDIKEVTNNTIYDDYYSHSVFWDFLFCYGFVGFFSLISFLILALKQIWESKDTLYIGLFALSLLMFTSHGSSLTMQFYAFVGLCISSTIKNK